MAQTKILITGATGYTGRYTTETLIEQGFSVRALVHRQDERSEKLRSTGAEITIGDMLDGAAARVRGVCQRSESSRLSHPQGLTRRYSSSRSSFGRRAAPDWFRGEETCRK